MRTILTSEDIKNIIDIVFLGNREEHNKTGVPYVNPNAENIVLIDEETGEQTSVDIVDYLNLHFYTWKKRLVETDDEYYGKEPSLFESWLQSLNFSMNESYALVEILDEEVVVSEDIDSSTKIGQISFLVQTNKIKNLEYYVNKVRSYYMGRPETIQNSLGDSVTAFLTLGTLLYNEEVQQTQIGECVIVTCNFRLSYLNEAQTYKDTKVEISFNGDDLYDATGQIVDENGDPTETKYLQMPITKLTWQNVMTSTPLPYWERPDLTGYISSSISCPKTISFYDYNKALTNAINEVFWRISALKIDGQATSVGDTNIQVYLRITNNGHFYIYRDMIDNMQKTITNGDFNISSITLKGWAIPD